MAATWDRIYNHIESSPVSDEQFITFKSNSEVRKLVYDHYCEDHLERIRNVAFHFNLSDEPKPVMYAMHYLFEVDADNEDRVVMSCETECLRRILKKDQNVRRVCVKRERKRIGSITAYYIYVYVYGLCPEHHVGLFKALVKEQCIKTELEYIKQLQTQIDTILAGVTGLLSEFNLKRN